MEPTAVARRTDPGTSWAAARSVDRIRETQREIVNILLIWGYLTDEEIASHYKGPQSPSGLRTRRSELVDAGLVFDSGARVMLKTGRKAIVWGLTAQGRG